jgi:hypothetical protein
MPIFGWLVGIKASCLHGNPSRRQADRLPTHRSIIWPCCPPPSLPSSHCVTGLCHYFRVIGPLRGEHTPLLDNGHCNLPTVPSQRNDRIHRSLGSHTDLAARLGLSLKRMLNILSEMQFSVASSGESEDVEERGERQRHGGNRHIDRLPSLRMVIWSLTEGTLAARMRSLYD